MILMFDRGRLLTAFGLLTVIAVVIGDGDWVPAKKPDYIPDDYIAVKPGDFKEYFELWSKGPQNVTLIKSTYNHTNAKIYYAKLDLVKDGVLLPMYNQSKYVYGQSKRLDQKWFGFDLVGINSYYTLFGYLWKYESDPDAATVLNEANRQFMFFNYLFVNSTHFLDMDKTADTMLKNGNDTTRTSQPYRAEKPPFQYIADIPNIKMTPFIKQQVMQKCHQKYCAFNFDQPGSGAIWASEDEWLVLYKAGLFLIAHPKKDNDPVYYTIKQVATGKHFYFPSNLPTFSSNDEAFQNDWNSEYKGRHYFFPNINANDEFFKRPDVQLPTTPRPTTTTTTSTTTTTTTTRRPKTTTEVTTTTEKSPKLGIARAAVKEVCTTTPEPKKSSGYSVIVGFVSVGMAIVWFWAPIV
ncbi:hypothetical protein M3Y94_00666600 [Aphelenchoides besseyi]|nr:hypothetical protein M3Y94_00666600 [Aphelenchoides besseyi]